MDYEDFLAVMRIVTRNDIVAINSNYKFLIGSIPKTLFDDFCEKYLDLRDEYDFIKEAYSEWQETGIKQDDLDQLAKDIYEHQTILINHLKYRHRKSFAEKGIVRPRAPARSGNRYKAYIHLNYKREEKLKVIKLRTKF